MTVVGSVGVGGKNVGAHLGGKGVAELVVAKGIALALCGGAVVLGHVAVVLTMSVTTKKAKERLIFSLPDCRKTHD